MTSTILAAAMAAMLSPHHPGPTEVSKLRLIAAQDILRARRTGIDPLLVAALQRQESGFDLGARGRAGELGLGQLLRGTKATRGYDDAPDAVLLAIPINVSLTVRHMARSRAACPGQGPEAWLSIYKGIRKRGGRCQTSAYARSILAHYELGRAVAAQVATNP